MQSNLNFDWHKDNANRASFQERRSTLEYFEEVFASELRVLPSIFEAALSATLADVGRHPPHYQLPSTKAQIMIGYIKGLLFDTFPDLMRSNGQRFYMEKGGYRMYFKKFNTNLRPMNNPTRNSRRIMNQAELFPDYVLVEVFSGYQLNNTRDDIRGMYSVYFTRQQIGWISDLSRFGGRNSADGLLGLTPPSGPEPDHDDGLTVVPKAI